MRGVFRVMVTIGALVALVAVPSGIRAGAPACPLSADARLLVEEIVEEAALDAVWVATNAHGLERGYALSLVGVDGGSTGTVFRIGECERRRSFDPYCERDPETGFVRCSRLACEAAGVDTVEVSISLGRPKLNKREPLRYATTTVAGEAVYEPFPSVVWRTVSTPEDRLGISAGIFRRVTVTPTGGQPIDLTHQGSVSISKSGDAITSLEIVLAFPLVAGGEPQVVVEVAYDGEGHATGVIRQGGRTLATIAGATELSVAWEDACAA